MDKDTLTKIKKVLEKERQGIEEELKSIAVKDVRNKNHWESRFPQSSGELQEVTDKAEKSDMVEEYANRLSIEHTLEEQLKRVDEALKKIEEGTYGICAKCKNKISPERLKVFPATDVCKLCSTKN